MRIVQLWLLVMAMGVLNLVNAQPIDSGFQMCGTSTFFNTNNVSIPKIDTGNQQKGKDTLTVGLNPEPPFIIKQAGDWDGASIYLWEKVAEDLGVPFRYREYDLKGLQKAVQNQKVDLAVTPMAVTSERLQQFHFTQPFFISNLSVAVQRKEGTKPTATLFV